MVQNLMLANLNQVYSPFDGFILQTKKRSVVGCGLWRWLNAFEAVVVTSMLILLIKLNAKFNYIF